MNTPHGMTILVTGGSGFLGRHLIAALAPDNTVVSLQRHEVRTTDRQPGVEYLYRDLVALRASDLPAGIDLVIHEAALIDAPGTPHDPSPTQLLEANVTATLQLLSVACELGIPRFVHGSSGSVYGASTAPITEDAALAPSNFYGLSKRLAEEIVTWHGSQFQSAVVLRYGTPVGRWCSNALLLSFLRRAEDGTPIDLGPRRKTLFNPIPVADAVRLTLLAAGLDGTRVFNVGGIATLSFEEMARRIAAELGRATVIVRSPPPAPPVLHRILRSDRIRLAVGEAANTPVSVAIEELVRWWRTEADHQYYCPRNTARH
jgi:UDP-glucose 4-epimerase